MNGSVSNQLAALKRCFGFDSFRPLQAEIIGAALALATAAHPAWGVALPFGLWCLAALWRLGHDWDDGIDVTHLLFPAPLDWGVKWERLVNFWTDDRPYFRAVHLACIVATIVMAIIVAPHM